MFERKNRPGGKIDASEEKGCQKEKALTSDGETESRYRFLQGLSKKSLSRGFLFVAPLFRVRYRAKNAVIARLFSPGSK